MTASFTAMPGYGVHWRMDFEDGEILEGMEQTIEGARMAVLEIQVTRMTAQVAKLIEQMKDARRWTPGG